MQGPEAQGQPEEAACATAQPAEDLKGWRKPVNGLSLPEVHSSVKVGLAWHQKVRPRLCSAGGSPRRLDRAQLKHSGGAQVMAFSGVGVLIAVGYM